MNWHVHILGADDLIPVPSRRDAMQQAHILNAVFLQALTTENPDFSEYYPTAWAVPQSQHGHGCADIDCDRCVSCHQPSDRPHTDYCRFNSVDTSSLIDPVAIRRAAFDEAIAKVSAAPDNFPVAVSVIKALLAEVRDGA